MLWELCYEILVWVDYNKDNKDNKDNCVINPVNALCSIITCSICFPLNLLFIMPYY